MTIYDITTSSSDALSLPVSLEGSLICCVSSVFFITSIKVNSMLFSSFNVLMASQSICGRFVSPTISVESFDCVLF